jgi:hypothetical protein
MPDPGFDVDDPRHGIVVLPIKDGRYFSVIANVYGKEARDWLLSVWRDGEGPWQIRYRFRYYTTRIPGDAWLGLDKKKFYEMEVDAKATEEYVLSVVRKLADMLVDAGFNDRLDWIECKTDKAAEVMAQLEARPWAHVKNYAVAP